MRILAFDPGTLRCGVSCLTTEGELLYSGLIILPPKKSMEDRLSLLYLAVYAEICSWYPAYVAVEEPVLGVGGVKSTLAVAQAQASILIAARHPNVSVPIVRIHTGTAKKAATGHGDATKDFVALAVAERFSLEPFTKKDFDISDSIAVGLAGLEVINGTV